MEAPSGRWIIYLPRGLGNHLAYLSNGGVAEDQEEANARLIAAAPDLVKNARANLSTMQWTARRLFDHELSHSELSMAIEETEAVIAKALGASPASPAERPALPGDDQQ